MKSITNILVPVDYSDNSDAAVDFAIGLAETHKAHLRIVNIYDKYAAVAAVAQSSFLPEGKSVEEYDQDLYAYVSAKFAPLGNTWAREHLTFQAIPGTPAETLVELSKTGEFDFIVMGMAGKKSISEIMFGSTATAVSQRADCPVLLVPSNSNYHGIDNIVYACDFDHTSAKYLNLVALAAEVFNAHVHLLFVKTEDSLTADYFHQMEVTKEIFHRKTPDMQLTVRMIEEDSVVEGVNNYTREVGADVVAIITKHRDFWGRIMHSSKTKEMAMYAEEPVLVIHAD